jgi:hypothetical protein
MLRRPCSQPSTALAIAAALLVLAGCARESQITNQVRTRFNAFPIAAQSSDAHPWTAGRFTGTCRRSILTFGGYACLYADEGGRRGYACFVTRPRLRVKEAIGPDERKRWTDHSGRVMPPERVC